MDETVGSWLALIIRQGEKNLIRRMKISKLMKQIYSNFAALKYLPQKKTKSCDI